MKQKSFHTPLNPILAEELKVLGQYLRVLRKRQNITIADMCIRIDANPRTVSKIEKGDPTVALGTFVAYINILGLARELSERILGDYLLVVTTTQRQNVFSDKRQRD
jgi:transcriptional regulator with XRE-family HTH domain